MNAHRCKLTKLSFALGTVAAALSVTASARADGLSPVRVLTPETTGVPGAWSGLATLFQSPDAPSASGRPAAGSRPAPFHIGLPAETSSSSAPPPEVVYPLDPINFGGPVIAHAVQHPVLLTPGGSCDSETCFGNPSKFLNDFGHSGLARVLRQYVGNAGSAGGDEDGDQDSDDVRYPVGPAQFLPLPAGLPTMPFAHNSVMTFQQIGAMVSSLAEKNGEDGYGHVYHVMLPPNVDACSDSSFSHCFSPDAPSAWYYCAAYQTAGSIDASGKQHTVSFTIVPNAATTSPYFTNFCTVSAGSPNGVLVDSTATQLESVLTAVVTNPGDPFAANGGPGWSTSWLVNTDPTSICQWAQLGPNAVSDFVTQAFPVELSGTTYGITPIYSKNEHRCVLPHDEGGDDEGNPFAASGSFARFYKHPSDLYNFGVATQERAVSRPIFLTDGSCVDASCYGDPQTFLDHLGRSRFIHVIDEYLASAPSCDDDGPRYTVVDPIILPLPADLPIMHGGTNRVMQDGDIQRIVAQVADTLGLYGAGNIYHVFLPPNVDLCRDSADTVCFSPDNNNTYAFGAYHGEFMGTPKSSPSTTVVYTAEPNNTIYGGDFQVSILSHELFETITDALYLSNSTAGWSLPFFGPGWEIGDDCEYLAYVPVDLAGRTYTIQREYSNRAHGCVNAP
jgi:hypothetical protein